MDPAFQSTGLEEGVCVFCDSPEQSEERYGKFLHHESSGINAHYYCLLFACGLSQRGQTSEGLEGFLVEDILTERKRAQKLKCKYCKKKGASVGCSVRACHQVYHYGCGVAEDAIYLFYDSFVSYCVKHRPVQNVLPSSCSPSKGTCPICIEKVETEPGHHVLKTPCCKGTWLHRECVQLQALSAGYFFRCPICNNENEFQEEMKKFGIYLPEKDAEWEYERDAYQDLYERHSRCDVDHCRCPKGRKYSTQSGQWEIVLCDLCGSAGCHMACGGLITSLDDWACKACTSLFTKELHQDESSLGRSDKKPSTTATPENRGGARARSAIRSHGKRPRAPPTTPRLVKKQRLTTPLCPPLSPVTGTHKAAPTESPISTPQTSIKFPKVSLSPTYLPDELRPGCSGIYVNRYKEMIPKLDCYVTLKHSQECADMSMPLLSPVESAGRRCKHKCGSKVKCKRARKLNLESCDHSPSITVTNSSLALDDSRELESKESEESLTTRAASTSASSVSLEEKPPTKMSWGSRLFGSVGSFLSWGKSQASADTQKTVEIHTVNQDEACKEVTEQEQQTTGEAQKKTPQTSSKAGKHSYEYYSPPPPLPSEVKAKILPVDEDQISSKTRNMLEGLTSWKDNETWIEAKEDLAQLFQMDGRATRSALKKGESQPAKSTACHTPKVKKVKKKIRVTHPLSSISVSTGGLKQSRRRKKYLRTGKKSRANKNFIRSPSKLLTQNLESSAKTKIQNVMFDTSSTSVSNTGIDMVSSQSTPSSSMSKPPDNLVDERLPEDVKVMILPVSPGKLSKRAVSELNALTSWKDDETWKEAKSDLAHLFQADGRTTRSAIQSSANADEPSVLEASVTCTISGIQKPSSKPSEEEKGNNLLISSQKISLPVPNEIHNQTTKVLLQDTPNEAEQAEKTRTNIEQHKSSTEAQLAPTQIGKLQVAGDESEEASGKLSEREKSSILPISPHNLSKHALNELNTLTSWKDDMTWKEAKGELAQLLKVDGRATRSVLQSEKAFCKTGSPSKTPKKGDDVNTQKTNVPGTSPQKSSKKSKHLLRPTAHVQVSLAPTVQNICLKGADTCEHSENEKASTLPDSPQKLPKRVVNEVSKLTSWKDDETWKEAKMELAQLLQVDGRATRSVLQNEKDPCKIGSPPRTPKKGEDVKTSRNLLDSSPQKSSKESKHFVKSTDSIASMKAENACKPSGEEKKSILPKHHVKEVSKLTSWKDDKTWKEAKKELAQLLQVDGRATRSVLQKERGLTPEKGMIIEGNVKHTPAIFPKKSKKQTASIEGASSEWAANSHAELNQERKSCENFDKPTANDRTINNGIQSLIERSSQGADNLETSVTDMKKRSSTETISKAASFFSLTPSKSPRKHVCRENQESKGGIVTADAKQLNAVSGFKFKEQTLMKANKYSKKMKTANIKPKDARGQPNKRGAKDHKRKKNFQRQKAKDTELPQTKEETPTKSNDQSQADHSKCVTGLATPSSTTKRHGRKYSCSHMRQPGTPPIPVRAVFQARQSPQVSDKSLAHGALIVNSMSHMIANKKDSQHRNTKGAKRRLENDQESEVKKHKKQEDITAYFRPLNTSRAAEAQPSSMSHQSRKRLDQASIRATSSSDVKQESVMEKQNSTCELGESWCISTEMQEPKSSQRCNLFPNAEGSEQQKKKSGKPRKDREGNYLPRKCVGQPKKRRELALERKSGERMFGRPQKTEGGREQPNKIRKFTLKGTSSERKIRRPRKTEVNIEQPTEIRELILKGKYGERKTEVVGEQLNKIKELKLKKCGKRKIGRPRKSEGNKAQTKKIREITSKGNPNPKNSEVDGEQLNKIRELKLKDKSGKRKIGRPRKSEGDMAQTKKIREIILKGYPNKTNSQVDGEQPKKIRKLKSKEKSGKRKLRIPRKPEGDTAQTNKIREIMSKGNPNRKNPEVDGEQLKKIRELALNKKSGKRKIGRPRKSDGNIAQTNKVREIMSKGNSDQKISEVDGEQLNKIRELTLMQKSGKRKVGRPRKTEAQTGQMEEIRQFTEEGKSGKRKVGRPKKIEGNNHKMRLTGIYQDQSLTARKYLARRRMQKDFCGYQHRKKTRGKGQLLIARSMFIKKKCNKHMFNENTGMIPKSRQPLVRRLPGLCIDQSTQTIGDLAEVERYIESKHLLYKEPARIPPFKRRSMATTAIARTQTYNLKYGNRCRVPLPYKQKRNLSSEKNGCMCPDAEPSSLQPHGNQRPKEPDQMMVTEKSVREPIPLQEEKRDQVQQAALNVLMRSAWIGNISTSVCDQSTETIGDLADVERYVESKGILYQEPEMLPAVKKLDAATAIGSTQTWNLNYGNPERMSLPSALSSGQSVHTSSGVCTEVPSVEEQDGKSYLSDEYWLDTVSRDCLQGGAKPVKDGQAKQAPHSPSKADKATLLRNLEHQNQPPSSPRRSARTSMLDLVVQTDSTFREFKGDLAFSKHYFEDEDPVGGKLQNADVKQAQTLFHMKSRGKNVQRTDQNHLNTSEAGTDDGSKHLKPNIEGGSCVTVTEDCQKLKGGSPQEMFKRPKQHDWFRIKPKK